MNELKNNNLVKTYRILIGLSQREMAEKMEMTSATYCRKENNPDKFNRDEIQKYMKIVNLFYPDLTTSNIFFV